MFAKGGEDGHNASVRLIDQRHCCLHLIYVDNEGVGKGATFRLKYVQTCIDVQGIGSEAVHSLCWEGDQLSCSQLLRTILYVFLGEREHFSQNTIFH